MGVVFHVKLGDECRRAELERELMLADKIISKRERDLWWGGGGGWGGCKDLEGVL